MQKTKFIVRVAICVAMLIGVQMASAYTGTCLMPPLFGLIANHVSVALLPVYLLVILVLMVVMHERVVRTCEG